MTWNLPNTLTVLRLLAAPILGLVYAFVDRPNADIIAVTIFVAAALTDFVDGYLARAWGQESRFGAMLDPIADKAMVVIALALVIGLSGLNPWVLIPAMLILTREVFVSGLREFLGADAKLLKVTYIAKWKTTAQMVAITALLMAGLFEELHGLGFMQVPPAEYELAMSGTGADPLGLRQSWLAAFSFSWAGLILLWVAGALTLISGLDYFNKAMPYLAEPSGKPEETKP